MTNSTTQIETRNLVAGEWLAGAGTIANVNPSDLSDIIGHHAQATIAQLDDAISAAQMAQKLWWAAGIQKRHDVLMAIGTEMMARAEEIGGIIAREEGKPMAISREKKNVSDLIRYVHSNMTDPFNAADHP